MARKLQIDVTADTKGLSRGLDGAVGKLKSSSAKMRQVGMKMTKFITLPLVGAGVAAVKMASDLAESMNASDIAFGKDAKVVRGWAKNLDSAFGLTQKQAFDLAGQLRLVTQKSGLTTEQMLKLSERAADVGSVFNVTSQEVGERFRSAMVGSSETVERFGVDTKITSQGMKDFAASIGKSVTELTEAEKQQGRYNIIMDQTSITANDAKNTQNTLAGQIRVTKAEFGRQAEELGTKLLPIGLKVIKFVGGLIDKFSALSPKTQNIILLVGGLAIALGPLITAIGALGGALAFVAANPAVLILAAIAAIGVAIFLLESDMLRGHRTITRAWTDIKISVQRDINSIIETINQLIRAFNNVLAIGDIIPGLPDIRVSEIPTVTVSRHPTGRQAGAKRALQTGGLIPGAPGQPVPIIAHGGEGIIRASDMRKRDSGRPIIVELVVDGRRIARAIADPVRRELLRTGLQNASVGLS